MTEADPTANALLARSFNQWLGQENPTDAASPLWSAYRAGYRQCAAEVLALLEQDKPMLAEILYDEETRQLTAQGEALLQIRNLAQGAP